MLTSLLLLSTAFDLKAEPVVTGLRFTEGPVWSDDLGLRFSDIPADRIYRIVDGKAVVWRDPSGNANGNALDRQGRLVTCHHGLRAVTRTERDGTVRLLAERWEGKRLNSPNDLVVASDGTIYFTDPPYGIRREQEEMGFNGVWRIASDGALTPLARDFDRPNGIGLSPDGGTLYVSDTARREIRAFAVRDGRLAFGRTLVKLDRDEERSPDGLRVDERGNVWCSVSGGVVVVSPLGERIGRVRTAEGATNVEFGGRDRRTLYVTAQKSVYSVRVPVPGQRR